MLLVQVVGGEGGAVVVAIGRPQPGGLFISKTVCVAEMPVWVPPILAVMRVFGRAPLLHRYSGAQIEARVARAGFDIVTSRIFGDVRYARFIVARRKV